MNNDCDGRGLDERIFGRGFDSRQVHTQEGAYISMLPLVHHNQGNRTARPESEANRGGAGDASEPQPGLKGGGSRRRDSRQVQVS